MKNKLSYTLLTATFLLFSVSCSAAPLNDFENNIVQLDISYAPYVNQYATGYDNISQQTATSEYSGNLTFVLSDIVALRAGGTSIATQNAPTPDFTTFGGVTQAYLQAVINPSEYCQPFVGVQYATYNLSSTKMQDVDYKAFGLCGGLQFTLPIAGLIKLNASGMLGQYANTAYAGASVCLTDKIDLDAGYFYEYYAAGKMIENGPGGNFSIETDGLRLGISLRI